VWRGGFDVCSEIIPQKKSPVQKLRNLISFPRESREDDGSKSHVKRNMKSRAIRRLVFAVAFSVACASPPIALAETGGQQAPQGTVPSAARREPLPNWSDPEFAPFVYSVVSIKPFKGDPKDGRALGTRSTPDGFSAAFPVGGLIYTAWYTPHYRLVGSSGWMETEFYDVEAKMDPDVFEAFQKLSHEKQKVAREHMLQVLLQERFKVVVHVEQRDIPNYDLVVAKNGPKLNAAVVPTTAASEIKKSVSGSAQTFDYRSEPVGLLTGLLTAETGRPVNDKTGLAGLYDFSLKYTPKNLSPDAQPLGDSALIVETAPTIERAIQEQLGLKLVPTTGLVNDIVIDHVERPTGN
jgi:uncharacterized protein (TIGR03435 family)